MPHEPGCHACLCSTQQPAEGQPAAPGDALLQEDASQHAADTAAQNGKRPLSAGGADEDGGPNNKKPAYYFEFAKKKWELEDTFRLPDGSYWPQVRTHITLIFGALPAFQRPVHAVHAQPCRVSACLPFHAQCACAALVGVPVADLPHSHTHVVCGGTLVSEL